MKKIMLIVSIFLLSIFIVNSAQAATKKCLPITEDLKQKIIDIYDRVNFHSPEEVSVVSFQKETFCYQPGIAILRIWVKFKGYGTGTRISPILIVIRYNNQRIKIVDSSSESRIYKKYPGLEDKMWLAGYTP